MSDNKKLKADVLDLLNQVMIKLNEIGEPLTYENYDYRDTIITKYELEDLRNDSETDDSTLKKYENFDEITQYLACVKAMIQRTLDGDLDSVAHNENQYYTSNC